MVEDRTIAGAEVTCLTTAPKAGTPIDGTGSGADTICLSAQGAQLLTDVGGERLIADTYATAVPAGTFEVCAPTTQTRANREGSPMDEPDRERGRTGQKG